MKTYPLILLVAVTAAVIMAGCTCSTSTSTPTPTPAPSATPAPTPTPQVTVTPGPGITYHEYLITYNREQYLGNGVKVYRDMVLYTDDWNMPVPQISARTATHGVIHKLTFENPTAVNATITASTNIKTRYTVSVNGSIVFLLSYDVFSDDELATHGTYSTFTIAPGKTKTVYMHAYIVDDSSYQAYRQYLDVTKVGIDAAPLG